MANFQDARLNEYQGSIDGINGIVFTDARTSVNSLAAANSEVVVDINGKSTVTFDVTVIVNLGANDLVIEGTIDGTNYRALTFWTQFSTIGSLPSQHVGAFVSPTAATAGQVCILTASCTGFRRVRMRKVSATGSANVSLRASESDLRILAQPQASTLAVTATAAVNAGATATLPAAPGLFHYITSIELVKLYSVVGVAAGAGVIVTSTNLPGGLAWTTEQLASAAGTVARPIDRQFGAQPLRSLAVGTATTFVAPAQLQTIWRWNVAYFLGE